MRATVGLLVTVSRLEVGAERASEILVQAAVDGGSGADTLQGRAGDGPDAALPGEVFSTVTVKAAVATADQPATTIRLQSAPHAAACSRSQRRESRISATIPVSV